MPASFRTLPALLRRRRFQPPPAELYATAEAEYLPGHATYTDYNYLSAGPLAQIKSAHFEAALDLVTDLVGTTGAIDFGCADGVFLPTLERWFDYVLGIDDDPDDRARAACRRCARAASRDRRQHGDELGELRERVDTARYGVVFLPRGSSTSAPPTTWWARGSPSSTSCSRSPRRRDDCALGPEHGRLAVRHSARGPGGYRQHGEPIAARDLVRAVVLKDVDRLEPKWQRHSHLGFNHRKLERAMRREFDVVGKRDLIFSKVYAVRTARASNHA
jgi:hypothetical protein